MAVSNFFRPKHVSHARKKFLNKIVLPIFFSNENESDFNGKEIEIRFDVAGSRQVAIELVVLDPEAVSYCFVCFSLRLFVSH